LAHATAKNPAERYTDVLSFVEDFRQAVVTADHRLRTAAPSLTPSPLKGEGWEGVSGPKGL
jgi:hypothetical protein